MHAEVTKKEYFGGTVILGALSCIPLFFLPVTQDFYDTNKWLLLVLLGAGILAVSVLGAVWKSKHIAVTLSPLTLGLGSITIASLISLVIVSPNKVEALAHPLGPVTFLALTILAACTPQFIHEKAVPRIRFLLYGVTSCISLITVYQFFGIGKTMFPGVPYLSDPLWTPTGSTITTVAIFTIILPLLLSEAFEAFKKKKESHTAFLIIMTIIVITGLGITMWQVVPKITSTFLSPIDGWAILLEILKNPKNALVGVGAENFLAAFSAGRPAAYNLSRLWSVRFTTNANLLFHLTTVYGLLGGAACLLFIKSFIPRKENRAVKVSLILSLIALFIATPSLTLLVVLTLLSLLWGNPNSKTVSWKVPHSPIVRIGITVLTAMVLIGLLVGIARFYTAELTFYQSLRAAQENNGTATYNLQVKAIGVNPMMSRFHIIYSQTNLVLATSLAASMRDKDAQMSADEKTKDRSMIAQLIQQSIREAKQAVKLNQFDILAWENLARTYQQLIGVAQGADSWTVASFKQAFQLDPTNPVLHLELGTTYVRLKDYTDAITQFQKAVSLKPNYANALYNLANAYKLSGDTDSAIRTLEITVSYIDKNSSDYTTVSQELSDLKKSQQTNNAPGKSDTSQSFGSITPTPMISPTISLPVNSGP
jgi:cytochrome c-type biogenesis protein CcmH/NrfG